MLVTQAKKASLLQGWFLKTHKGVERKCFTFTYIHIALIISKLFAITYIYTAQGGKQSTFCPPSPPVKPSVVHCECLVHRRYAPHPSNGLKPLGLSSRLDSLSDVRLNWRFYSGNYGGITSPQPHVLKINYGDPTPAHRLYFVITKIKRLAFKFEG